MQTNTNTTTHIELAVAMGEYAEQHALTVSVFPEGRVQVEGQFSKSSVFVNGRVASVRTYDTGRDRMLTRQVPAHARSVLIVCAMHELECELSYTLA